MPKWGACWGLAEVSRFLEPDKHWDNDVGHRDIYLIECRIDHVGVPESADPDLLIYAVQEVLCVLLGQRDAVMESRAQVQPVVNPITGSKEVDLSMPDDARLARLRFFRDLSEDQRRRILIELGAIPEDLTDRLDHTIEQRFFAKLIAQGRVTELTKAIDVAAEEPKKGDAT